jgi:hypothetical protein
MAPALVEAAEVFGSEIEAEWSAEPNGITQYHGMTYRKDQSTYVNHHFVMFLDGL